MIDHVSPERPSDTAASPTPSQGRLDAFAAGLVDSALAGKPEGAGAVALGILRPGTEPMIATAGRTVTFAADGSALPADDPRSLPVSRSTLFDLASVTKIVTTLVAATFLDEGALDLDASVHAYLPARAVPDARITVRQLMTHTSGLPPVLPLWRIEGSREAKLDAIGQAPLIAEPGTRHAYSCIGFITLGRILETLGGASLPELARERVLTPAGTHASGEENIATWWLDAQALRRTAATEYGITPPRGLVQGEVHDETAWSLGGAGNAGLFADIDGALSLGAVLAGTAQNPVLSASVRTLLSTDLLGDEVPTDAPWRQGLGLRVGQVMPDGRLLSRVIGHPGFTGTAIWADPETGTVAALLTNRVHPDRERFGLSGAREEFCSLAFGDARVTGAISGELEGA